MILCSCATSPTLVEISQFKQMRETKSKLLILPAIDNRIENKLKNDITINGINEILNQAYISSGLFSRTDSIFQNDRHKFILKMELLDSKVKKYPSLYSFGPGVLTMVGTGFLLKSIIAGAYYIPVILGGAIILWDLALGYEYIRVYSVQARFVITDIDNRIMLDDTLTYSYEDRFSSIDQYRVKKSYGYDYYTTTIDENKLNIMQLSRCINNLIIESADSIEKVIY